MMTFSSRKIVRVSGPLRGEFTGDRWIPLTKASDAELYCFLWSASEQAVEQTIWTPVIWDAIALIMYDVTVVSHGELVVDIKQVDAIII